MALYLMRTLYINVHHTVVRGPPVVQGGLPGCPQAVLEEKILQKIVSDTGRMKYIPIPV
jgi:hypothetical protein